MGPPNYIQSSYYSKYLGCLFAVFALGLTFCFVSDPTPKSSFSFPNSNRSCYFGSDYACLGFVVVFGWVVYFIYFAAIEPHFPELLGRYHKFWIWVDDSSANCLPRQHSTTSSHHSALIHRHQVYCCGFHYCHFAGKSARVNCQVCWGWPLRITND